MRQAKRLSGGRGQQRPGVIDGDDRGQGTRLREGDDALGRIADVLEVEPQVATVHQAGERRPVLRADHDLDVQAGGCGHEIVGAIGSARDQQQDAGHLF